MIDFFTPLAPVIVALAILALGIITRDLIRWACNKSYARQQAQWFADHPGASWNDFVKHNRGES